MKFTLNNRRFILVTLPLLLLLVNIYILSSSCQHLYYGIVNGKKEKQIGDALASKGAWVGYISGCVDSIHCYSPDKPKPNISDKDVEMISQLSCLQYLSLCTDPLGERNEISDQALQYLGTMKHLKNLSLINTSITDQGLKEVSKIATLESLYLSGTRVTDDGVWELRKLRRLRRLGLTKTNVTREGVKRLRKCLPECKISFESKEGSGGESGDNYTSDFYI